MSDTIALKIADQKKHTKSTKVLKRKLKEGKIVVDDGKAKTKTTKDKADDKGLVYLGHLPHGFFEDEIKQYFKQFGVVTNVKVCRSRKTGNSKGFGYVEFAHQEVAKIAAETMNNYVMFKKRIIAEFVTKEKRPRKIFQGKQSMPGRVSTELRRERQRAQRNVPIDKQTHKVKCKKAMNKLQKKLTKLQNKGIKYDLRPINVPSSLKTKAKKKVE